MIKTSLLLLTGLLFATLGVAQSKVSFSYKTYGNIANYFESENDLLTFFNFHKGDVIAEVGAGDGQNIAGLSLLINGVSFYAQDINSQVLQQKRFDKLIKNKNVQANSFHLCIGNEKATLLPDSSFDKIILSATFHEFTFMDEMLIDLSKKLKPNGEIYILESHCQNKEHKNYTSEETIEILKKHGFKLIKKDGKDLNRSSGLYRTIFLKQ